MPLSLEVTVGWGGIKGNKVSVNFPSYKLYSFFFVFLTFTYFYFLQYLEVCVSIKVKRIKKESKFNDHEKMA